MGRENLSSGFPTRSDTNRAVQLQKMDRGLKFRILEVEGCTIFVDKTNALIDTAQLVRAFVFAMQNVGFLMSSLYH